MLNCAATVEGASSGCYSAVAMRAAPKLLRCGPLHSFKHHYHPFCTKPTLNSFENAQGYRSGVASDVTAIYGSFAAAAVANIPFFANIFASIRLSAPSHHQTLLGKCRSFCPLPRVVGAGRRLVGGRPAAAAGVSTGECVCVSVCACCRFTVIGSQAFRTSVTRLILCRQVTLLVSRRRGPKPAARYLAWIVLL